MMSIFWGFGAFLIGLLGLWHWHAEFWYLLKGLMPLSICFAGIVAVAAGLSSLTGSGSSTSDKDDEKG